MHDIYMLYCYVSFKRIKLFTFIDIHIRWCYEQKKTDKNDCTFDFMGIIQKHIIANPVGYHYVLLAKSVYYVHL